MRTRQLLFVSAVVLSAIAGSPGTGRSFPPAPSPDLTARGAPRVALLATMPGALHTSLYVVAPGEAAVSAPVATFTHLPGATVRAAVLPGTTTLVATADTAETRDLSYNASLFRVAPHTPPERLCDGVVHASRPLVTADGRVFVSRGTAGPEPASAKLADMRVDALSIEEVDPSTGMLRTVHTASGYMAFLAGSYGREILVYRVYPGGADVRGVDVDTGAERAIVPDLPPFARDFSVDVTTGTLVYQGRHETDPHVWVIESVDLVTLAHDRLLASASMNMVPHALPGGAVAYNPDGLGGLTILGGTAGGGPLGGGADWVLAASETGQWLSGLHTVQGRLPAPFVLDTASGKAAFLRAPPGARVAVAGFFAADGGAL